MSRIICLAFVAIVLLFSCGHGDDWVVYNEVEIANDWNQEDALRLALNPSDNASSDLYLTVTHAPDFQYENIYLKYALSQQGKIISKELISIPLMSKDGLWTGDKQGENYSCNILLRTFDLTKPISIEILQQSRENKLGGVVAIGVGVQ